MSNIEFKGKVANYFIKNLKAARFIALIDFWVGIVGMIFFGVMGITGLITRYYIGGLIFLIIMPIYLMPIIYGGSYLSSYNKLKKNQILRKDSGAVEKRILFPFYLTISGVRYKGIHQLLNYARQMGKDTTFYEYKNYANVGDKVEITHMEGYILKISKVD